MRRTSALALAAVLVAPSSIAFAAEKCGPDSVEVGPTCVDKYEASVWEIPTSATALLKKVKKGKATLDDVIAGGAVQRYATYDAGCDHAQYTTAFPASGNWTEPRYALSLPGVQPSACLSWFQAEQACALSGKRLLTNQEWQRAAAGTPDPSADNGVTDCNYASVFGPVPTGSRIGCVSRWGVYDMVGNVSELIGDWDERAQACSFNDLELGGDATCYGGAGDGTIGASERGGYWDFGVPNSGVFYINSSTNPESRNGHIGFRCGR